jgi:hypothetical protein
LIFVSSPCILIPSSAPLHSLHHDFNHMDSLLFADVLSHLYWMCARSLVFPFHLAALLSVYLLSFLTPPSDIRVLLRRISTLPLFVHTLNASIMKCILFLVLRGCLFAIAIPVVACLWLVYRGYGSIKWYTFWSVQIDWFVDNLLSPVLHF